jgi:hypothetical protein
MKHAGTAALDRLETLLCSLRKMPALKEKSRGVFYRQDRAFIHFHEDGKALYADVRFRDDFERLEITGMAARAVLVKKLNAVLKS